MNFNNTRVWLEEICGKAGGPVEKVPNAKASIEIFNAQQTFLRDTAAGAVEGMKGEIKSTLSNVKIKGSVERGRLLPDKSINVEVLASLKGGKVPTGIEQEEWDSYAEQASTLETIVIDGTPHAIDSSEAAAYLQTMGKKLAPLYKLSQEMANAKSDVVGPDGQKLPLFSARDIEKELWSPLVREGVIPSNLVPKDYSETVNVMRNGAAVYNELMAQEDGSDMGPKKGFDKFLDIAKDTVELGKVVGGEVLRYENLAVAEASREDIALFLQARGKTVDSSSSEDLQTGDKLREAFGEYTRQQAMLTCASAFATGTIETAQRARDRKRTKGDVAEAVAESLLDVIGGVVTATTSASDLTQNQDTMNREYNMKYALLATKAGVRGINKIAEVAASPHDADPTEVAAKFCSAISDFIDVAAEGVTASGEKTNSGDTRFEQSQTGLIIKGVAIGMDKLVPMIDAIRKRDFGTAISLVVAAGVSIPSTMFAGNIGDLTRDDVTREEIDAGVGSEGNNQIFGNPFIELDGAAGQTGFGMNGDLATLADQRSVVVEARALFDQIGAESYADAKGDVKKKFERIQKMAAANPELAQEAEIAAFLDPDPLEPLTKEQVEAALARILRAIDMTQTQSDAQAAVQDDQLIDSLSADVDHRQLKTDVDEMRDMLGNMDGDDAPDDAAIFEKFKEIRDNMLKDERVLEGIRREVAEEDAWIEQLKAEADLTRLDQFTDPTLREREHDKAISAIQELTLALKKTEMKLNILDQITKGAVGVVLMAVPGAAILGKIRDLVADSAKLNTRAKELRMWQRQMENIRGNYSPYEYAVSGEKHVTEVGVVHDSFTVAADVAGVAAETLRLADHTHITAAVLTSFEKLTKALNDLWYKKWGEYKIKEGWRLYKSAIDNPENRRLARAAIEGNTTLGKCVLVYGACVDKDPQARSVLQATGLTPEAFEDGADVCQAAVQYLRARLHDSETEIMADHDSEADWVPCRLEIKLANWTMIKGAACRLDPALSKKSCTTPDIDIAFDALEKIQDDNGATADQKLAAATRLHQTLTAYRGKKEDGKIHAEMTLLSREYLSVVQKQRAQYHAAVQNQGA